MPQPLKTLRPGRSARDWFGAELRHWRLKRGLTQAELGRQAWTSGSLIGKIETAERDCPEELARKLDEVLDTGGVLGRAQELVRSRRPAMLIPAPRHESALAETGTTQSLWTWNGDASPGESASLEALPGSFFGGATVEVGIHHASRGSGHVLVETPEDQSGADHRPRLLIGLSDGDDRRMIALNERRARRARREGRHSGDRVRLRIPDAYVLDDLTLGVLWAVSSLDSALLYDDALITELREELDAFAAFRRSSAGRDMVAELTAVSQLWVGSDFCARYILQQSERLTSAPDFWTRERTGEEASTWLLFAHKHDYLRALSNRFPSGATRSFCLPEATVSKAPRAERILFLLTAALMESFGIRVQVSDEPAYGAVEGFVLNPGEQAIVANWLGSDGVWHVDMTDSTPTLREYTDVTGYAHAHSVISADTSRGRLCSLAEYLDVNWAWLVSRCAQIGAYGFAGLAPPSSRLLSTAGVDRACRFIGRTGSSGR